MKTIVSTITICLLFSFGCKDIGVGGISYFGDEQMVYLTCNINDTAWASTVYPGDSNYIMPDFIYAPILHAFSIQGSRSDTIHDTVTLGTSITLMMHIVHTGVYPLVDFTQLASTDNADAGAWLSSTRYGAQDNPYTAMDTLGYLDIIGIDSTKNNRIWGSFYFTTQPDTNSFPKNKPVAITNGKFNLQYK